MKKLNLAPLAATLLLAVSTSSYAGLQAPSETSEDKTPKWDVNQPMGEFTQAAIDTSEGTWMNIDVSPDGSTVVFDLLGDIYSLAISGGEAKALMQDIAWQMQPQFSPDGKRIAFTSDQGGGDNIWTMNIDGSDQQAVTEETFRLLNSPAWSPNGDYIVARKHFTDTRSLGAGEVWMYHKAGGEGLKLTKRPNDQKDLGEPAFSPDGRYVYFSHDATPGKTFHYSKDSEKGIYKIKRYDRESGDIEVVISGPGGAIRPTPSPDGKFLAYIGREDFQSVLLLLNLETGEKTKLYDKLERDMQETWAIHGVYPTMAWTPDNKNIVFWAKGKIHKLNLASKQDSVIPFHVKADKKIQTAVRFQQDLDQDNFDVKMLRNVQLSPDGKSVVFEALGHIYSRALPDGKPKRLTKQTSHFELNPSFSRDGKSVVYSTWDDQELGSLRLVSSRGGRSKQITKTPGKYIEASFSPDGKTITYRKIEGGYITDKKYGVKPGIYTIPSKGGEAKFITKKGVLPQYGKSSDNIYVMRHSEKPSLVRVNIKDLKEQILYEGKYATEYKISPDGKYLAFAERFKVFVTPFIERGSVISIGPKAKNLPIRKLSVRAGENINWNADSDGLQWSLGPDLYQASISGMFDIGSSTSDKKKSKNDNVSITPLGFSQASDIPSGKLAFVGGQVISMKNGNEVIPDGVVITDGNHIIAVGKAADVVIPSDAKKIDITGKTIMPGLIDAHAHGPQGSDEIIPQQNWKNYAGLSLGVTTIHDPSNDTTEFFAASELQKSGQIVGPRLFSTGTILYGASGPGYTSHVDKLEDAKFHLLRLKKAGAFSVKSYNQPRRNQRQQIIQAARELEMMVVPEGGSLLQHNLSMIADGHTTLEHSLPVEKVYQDIKQFWSASEMAYTPTLIVAYGGIWGEHYWYDKTDVWKHPRLSKYVPADILGPRSMRRKKAPDHHYNHISVAKTAKELNDIGILTNIGAHGQREGLGAHWELWMYVQGGMSPLQALNTATVNPAKSLGLDKTIGSLEKGKLADLIVIDGDPLNDIRISDRVDYVMVNGRLFNAETMNEVGNRDNKREKFYFEK